MSQLQDLLSRLNKEELPKVRSIKLRGKEKEVFDYSLKNAGKAETGEITSQFGLSETHSYKINSVLLQKCYQAIIPQGGKELLAFLIGKDLYTLFRYELNHQEKLIKNLKDAAKLEDYCLRSFHLLIDLPFKFYDKKLLDLYGEKYVKSNPKFGEAEKEYVRFHKLFSDCNRLAARKNPKRAFVYGLKDLEKFEQELESTNYWLARYYLYRTFCSYFTYYEKDPKKHLEYLDKAIALKDKIAFFFPVNIGQFLHLMRADALFFNGNTDEAFKIYRKVFGENVSEELYGYFYHCEQYGLTLIIKGLFEESELFLNKHFREAISQRRDIFASRGLLAFAKLYLSIGDFKKSIECINKGRQVNEKAFYLPFDFQWRVIENIYFIRKKDYSFAKRLAAKNIKFVNTQEDTNLHRDYLDLFKAFSAICTYKEKKSKLPEELIKETYELQNNFQNLYCRLIGMVVQ